MDEVGEERQRPVSTVYHGKALRIAIWKNHREKTENGRIMKFITYNVVASRRYQGNDGNMKDSGSFREADLLKMAELFREADRKVRELRLADEQEKQQMEIQSINQKAGPQAQMPSPPPM